MSLSRGSVGERQRENEREYKNTIISILLSPFAIHLVPFGEAAQFFGKQPRCKLGEYLASQQAGYSTLPGKLGQKQTRRKTRQTNPPAKDFRLPTTELALIADDESTAGSL